MQREPTYVDYLSQEIPRASNEFYNVMEMEFIKLKQKASTCSLKCFQDIDHLKKILKEPNLEQLNIKNALLCANKCQQSVQTCEQFCQNKIQQLDVLHTKCLESEKEFAEQQLIFCFQESLTRFKEFQDEMIKEFSYFK